MMAKIHLFLLVMLKIVVLLDIFVEYFQFHFKQFNLSLLNIKVLILFKRIQVTRSRTSVNCGQIRFCQVICQY